jgi:CubicO group peptidase (beta-lactamase class C family)
VPSKIPGSVFLAASKDGSELFSHAAGTTSASSSTPMSADKTVFWIASCTKLITSIAALQLVERDILSLDNAQRIEALVPELADLRVLSPDGTTLLPRTDNGITLRMLLTHTAGFAYTFFETRLLDYALGQGWDVDGDEDEFSGHVEHLLRLPLVHQPGETWCYGTGIDWAGLAVERATGMKLGEVMEKNIFGPLGLERIKMVPTSDMRRDLAGMHQRDEKGQVYEREHLLKRSLDPSQAKDVFHSGGAGLFARPKDYLRESCLFSAVYQFWFPILTKAN